MKFLPLLLAIVILLLGVDVFLRVKHRCPPATIIHDCGSYETKPVEDVWIDDPSLAPFVPLMEYQSPERYRVVGDFNGDGIDDLALSEDSISMMRGDFGGYAIYLGRVDGKFKKIGEIEAFASSLAIEKTVEGNRIWWYARCGGGFGYVKCAMFGGQGLDRREGGSLGVYVGDNGTDWGNGISSFCSVNNSDVPLRVEISKTIGETVTWAPVD